MPEEDDPKPCKVPGCTGKSFDDDGYCHGHRSDRNSFIRLEMERERKKNETLWDKLRKRGRI
jgi:hypothetical protein